MTTVRSGIRRIRVLADLIERIERLEAAAFHGFPVITVYVPDGMTVEAAWRRQKNGQQLIGKRTYILTDNSGNVLKVLN